MVNWWTSLSLFQQIMVFIATPSTLIILVQFILLLFGFGGEDSFDTVDTDIDLGEIPTDAVNNESFVSLGGIKIFSVRSILSFLSIGGWLSMALAYTLPNWLAGIIGILGGALVAFLIALAFHNALKLQSSGNINYRKAIGLIGTVYIRIPPHRTGNGKINMTLQERYIEVDAVTDDKDYINTGLPVKVIAIENETTVVVERCVIEN